MEESNSCYVDTKLFPHLFLIPAAVILTVLAFLNKRKSYRKDVLDGRPGLVIPFDFLGFDHDRLTICAIFGAMTVDIVALVTRSVESTTSNKWVKSFRIIGYCLECAFLYYPIVACLTTKHKLIGSLMGFCYTALVSVLSSMVGIGDCRNQGTYSIVIPFYIPILLCYLFILGKFLKVFYSAVLRRNEEQGDCNETLENCLAKPWVRNYVEELLKPRFRMLETKWARYTRVIYSPEKNFKFSVQTVSIVTVCGMTLYMVFVVVMNLGSVLLHNGNLGNIFQCRTKLEIVLGISLLVSSVITGAVSAFSLVRFMDCHKSNMLRVFKGDTSFIPTGFTKSHLMMGKSLKYAGFQIAYFVWGCVITSTIVFVIAAIAIALFDCKTLLQLLKERIVTGVVPVLVVAILVYLILILSSMLIFHDKDYPKNVIALENRNLYLVFSYFFFFLALPVGFSSSVLRIIKAMVVGFFTLPRIDTSIMPKGFERLDKGFSAYISYLHVLAAHRNPVLRLFCQFLCDSTNGRVIETERTKYRNKWFLLFTLARNPQLQAFRKHRLSPIKVQFLNDDTNEVLLEVV